MNDWDYIKEFYKEHFGIDNWVVEMMANRDILLLCASGASNKTISNFLDISEGEIELVIKEAFDFIGWEQDLSCNPYKIYQDHPEEFRDEVSRLLEVSPLDVALVASICRSMQEIEERIYNEWI